jgi:hypothetical protein
MKLQSTDSGTLQVKEELYITWNWENCSECSDGIYYVRVMIIIFIRKIMKVIPKLFLPLLISLLCVPSLVFAAVPMISMDMDTSMPGIQDTISVKPGETFATTVELEIPDMTNISAFRYSLWWDSVELMTPAWDSDERTFNPTTIEPLPGVFIDIFVHPDDIFHPDMPGDFRSGLVASGWADLGNIMVDEPNSMMKNIAQGTLSGSAEGPKTVTIATIKWTATGPVTDGSWDITPGFSNPDGNDGALDGNGDPIEFAFAGGKVNVELTKCTDLDGDGYTVEGGDCGQVDNCPDTPNPDQTDTDNDGIGDACEADLILDFGASGIWGRYNDTMWEKIHKSSSEIIATGDMDGSGEDDVITDFGASGIWVYYNNTTWTKLHKSSPEMIATGDLDGSGQDETIIDFGAATGLWVRYNDTDWSKIHNSNCKNMAVGEIDGN